MGVTRAPHLNSTQSDWIMGQLAKWQDEHAGCDRSKKPEGRASKEVYQDMRCAGIDAGVLKVWHNQDICRSHIKSKLSRAT